MTYYRSLGNKKKILWGSVVLCCALVIFWVVFAWFRADVLYARGQLLVDRGSLLRGAEVLERSVSLWSVEPAYRRELAAVYARLAGIYSGEDRRELLKYADKEAQKAYSLNSRNLLTLKSLITTYYAMSLIDDAYQAHTMRVLEEALEKCPNDPTLWYLKGVVYGGFGDQSTAKSALKQTLELRPNYPKARQSLETY